MIFCTNCGHQLMNGEKFCTGCGRSLDMAHNGSGNRMVFDGKVYKCPNCGELLDSFIAVCPACNYELRGTQTTSCVHELSQKLEKTGSMEKKIELISNFYIPNTKEDIYEFFILAYSNITGGGHGIDAWKVKLEQTYLKAKLVFGGSADFKYIDELYGKIKKASLRHRIFESIKQSLFLIGGIFLILMGSISGVPIFALAGLVLFIIGVGILSRPKTKHHKTGKKERV